MTGTLQTPTAQELTPEELLHLEAASEVLEQLRAQVA